MLASNYEVPVVTVDGPSGAGKGTISLLLARELGWHYLDSGALYRVLAFDAIARSVDLEDEVHLQELARSLPVKFVEAHSEHVGVFLGENEVTTQIRNEGMGKAASKIASYPAVRAALIDRQRDFKKMPGLVADGRDMGTTIFPKATLKIFLDASVQERAVRRQKQLQKVGIDVNLQSLFDELKARDLRDRTRPVSPLKAAEDAVMIDTTGVPIESVFSMIRQFLNEKGLV